MQLTKNESLAMSALFNEESLREALSKKYESKVVVDGLIDFAFIIFIEGAERYKSLLKKLDEVEDRAAHERS